MIGCVGSATYSLLPALAATLRDELPGVDFAFRGEMLVPDQVAALRGGSSTSPCCDRLADEPGLAMRDPAREPAASSRCRTGTGCRPPPARVADLAGRGPDRPRRRRALGDARALVDELCRDAGFEPQVRHEVAETSTLVTFVAAGLGVAVVPEPTSVLSVPGVVYVPLVGTPGVDLVVATRQGDDNPVLVSALARLRELVKV